MTDPIAQTPQRYDRTTVRLHWITAVLVVLLWLLGQTIDWFPRGDARIYARSTHIGLGTLLVAVVAWRIFWRATGGRRLPTAELGRLRAAATVGHFLLYVLVVCTLLFGVANVWMRGDNIFNLFRIPAFDPNNRALRGFVEDWHGNLADALLILAGLHALAGLIHHYVLKDRVLGRMGPGG